MRVHALPILIGTFCTLAIAYRFSSAFLAARAGSFLGMTHVLEAARSEFRKLDRPINETDFRWPAAKSGAVA